jgi:hypothetical protein
MGFSLSKATASVLDFPASIGALQAVRPVRIVSGEAAVDEDDRLAAV